MNEELQKEAEQLQTQLEAVSKERDEYLDGWKRAKADYINFKNDQEKRARELSEYAQMHSAIALVPALEHFRMAFSNISEDIKDNTWTKGIEQIYKQLKDIAKTMGLEEVSGSVGAPFDPSKHEAVGHEAIEGTPDDQITQELSAGYSFNGKVVYPAKVIVNKLS